MVLIKTPKEIENLLESGKIARKAVDEAVRQARVGMSTMELNNIAEKVILEAGGKPCFNGFEGFPAATCVNVNSGVVHGLPGNYKIKAGDVVSIDLGVLYKGMITDVSESFELETTSQTKFLEVGRKALNLAISACVVGNRLGDVGYAIESTIKSGGYTVSRDLVGHWVGRKIHEDPLVPGYGKPGKGERLVAGMTLAIEVIYQKGQPELVLDADGWTLKTKDGSMSGLFEKSVAVMEEGVLVLT